jgi:hypothetical protein
MVSGNGSAARRVIKEGCRGVGLSLVLVITGPSLSLAADVNVWTQHNDNARTGWNSQETQLRPALIHPGQRHPATFGKLFSHALDDQSYSQPLYVSNLRMSDNKIHNVVFVSTVNNSVYAWDADKGNANGGKPLWYTNVTPPGARPPNVLDMNNNNQSVCSGNYRNFAYNFGIVGTPVIDVAKNAIYFVARTAEINNQFFQRIHALDIRSGKEILGGPKTIAPSWEGSTFDAFNHNQRAALTLVDGVVYIAWASHCDSLTYKGWVVGYRASDLALVVTWNDEPNGGYGGSGGIWQGGQGLTADAAGNLYVLTGNGNWDPSNNNYGMSALKLRNTGQGSLVVSDFFTPFNHADLNHNDLDLGSAGALLIPGSDFLVGGGKEGILYVMDTNHMGGVTAGPPAIPLDRVVEEWYATGGASNQTHHIHGSPVYFNGGPSKQYTYVWGENDGLKAYSYVPGAGIWQQYAARSLINSPLESTGMPGGFLSVSSNGISDGIVWALLPAIGDSTNKSVPGTLVAFDATKFDSANPADTGQQFHQLWSSDDLPSRDSIGYYAKFTYPTIANGKVYVVGWGGAGSDDCVGRPMTAECSNYTSANPPRSSGQLLVYGLYAQAPPPPPPPQCTSKIDCTGNIESLTCRGKNVSVSWNGNCHSPGVTFAEPTACAAGSNGSSTITLNATSTPRLTDPVNAVTDVGEPLLSVRVCTSDNFGSNCTEYPKAPTVPTCVLSAPSNSNPRCGENETFCDRLESPRCVTVGQCPTVTAPKLP